MTEYYADSVFINIVHDVKTNAEILPFSLKFLIIVLFGTVNLDTFKQKLPDNFTVELARLIMWSMFFFLMFIVLLHLISVLFK
jgi:hypothetical protein